MLTANYDDDGNRVSLTATINGKADFQNTYSYNDLNEMLEVAQSAMGGENSDAVTAKSAAFSYDSAGNVTAVSRFADDASHTTADTYDLVAKGTYGYDGAGRLTSLTYSLPAGSTSTVPSYVWIYNAANEITDRSSMADSSPGYSVSEYTTSGARPLQLRRRRAIDQYQNRRLEGLCRDVFQLAKRAAGGKHGQCRGLQLRCHRQQHHARLCGQCSRNTTGDNQISSDGTYDYYYDANGNLVKQVAINGGSEIDYQYDYRNRLTEVTNKDSSGRITQTVVYSYDAFNRLIGRFLTQNTYTGTRPRRATQRP